MCKILFKKNINYCIKSVIPTHPLSVCFSPNSVRSLLQDPFERRTLMEKLGVKELGPDQPACIETLC